MYLFFIVVMFFFGCIGMFIGVQYVLMVVYCVCNGKKLLKSVKKLKVGKYLFLIMVFDRGIFYFFQCGDDIMLMMNFQFVVYFNIFFEIVEMMCYVIYFEFEKIVVYFFFYGYEFFDDIVFIVCRGFQIEFDIVVFLFFYFGILS